MKFTRGIGEHLNYGVETYKQNQQGVHKHQIDYLACVSPDLLANLLTYGICMGERKMVKEDGLQIHFTTKTAIQHNIFELVLF